MPKSRGMRHVCALIVVSATVLGVAPGRAQERVVVPGGIEAVSRLMGGGLREEPSAFVYSLNRALLASTDKDHEWKDVEARVRLVQYLDDLEQLRRRFSPPVEVGLSPKPLRRNFQGLAAFLGYNTKIKGKSIELVPEGGDGGQRRRRLAQALGWDLSRVAGEIEGGGRTTLAIADGEADLPLLLADWRITVGDGPPIGTLEALAKNQRLSYVIEARRRLSDETRAVFEEVGWNWVYRKAPVTLYRYASALRVRDGELVIPGGSASVKAWAELLGVQPTGRANFLRELLTMKGGRAAYLWHALTFLPPATAQFYLGAGEALTSDERRFVKKVFRRLDESSRVDFDSPRGGDLGFGTFARSVPLTADNRALDLPGGAGLWFVAIKHVDAPKTSEAVTRVAAKGRERPLDEGEFLLKSLTETVQFTSHEKPALPRLIRTANMFPQSPELMTPPNVVLLARSTDTVPSALGVLDEMVFTSAETVRQYLLAVFRLDVLDRDVERELLILNFQAGIEWLRAMSRAGRVEPGRLEQHLSDWARLHWNLSDPYTAAPKQLAWIRDVIVDLPSVGEAHPGRGPLEGALVAALTPYRDPQAFSWGGLDYTGERGARMMRSMVDHLERQGIPSADDVVRLSSLLESLRSACAGSDLETSRRLARETADLVQGFGGTDFAAQIADKKLRQRVGPSGREDFLRQLERIEKQKKAAKLPGMAEDVVRAQQRLASELRPFLLAPGYLSVMADSDNILFEDPFLIRKHVLIPLLDLNAGKVELWQGAEVQMADEEALGSQVAGHPADVTAALAEVSLAQGGGRNLLRDRIWFEDYMTTRWGRVSPSLSGLVAAAIRAGDDVVERAKQEIVLGGTTVHAEFVCRWVPFARLEREAVVEPPVTRVSVSERFVIGLQALEERAEGTGDRLALSEESWEAFATARAELGTGWRDSLDFLGGRTPSLNGRVRPHFGFWPPYEAVEYEVLADALLERELLDVRVAVLDFLGRHELPGVLGRDLLRMTLADASGELRLESQRDWEGHVRWVDGLDDDYFEGKLRECFNVGLYTLRL